MTPRELFDVLVRYHFGDLRPPPEPVVPAPPPAVCARSAWTVYMTMDLCPRRWLSAWWGSYQCQPTAVRCGVTL